MSATVVGAMQLGEVRARVAAALEPTPEDDLTVWPDYPDAIHPPTLILLWDDPWLEPGVPQGRTMGGPCLWNARLVVWCVAGRLEPGEGVTVLEELVAHTLDALQADSYPWPPANVAAPRVWTIGNVNYLGCRVAYQIPVSV